MNPLYLMIHTLDGNSYLMTHTLYGYSYLMIHTLDGYPYLIIHTLDGNSYLMIDGSSHSLAPGPINQPLHGTDSVLRFACAPEQGGAPGQPGLHGVDGLFRGEVLRLELGIDMAARPVTPHIEIKANYMLLRLRRVMAGEIPLLLSWRKKGNYECENLA